MKAVSARAARASISALLDLAEAGESTLIIRNSKAAAILAPVPAPENRFAYDPDEVRWYRPHGSHRRVGFLGAANAAFLARPRAERAKILEALAAISHDAPIVVIPLSSRA
jgi:antitoxin (DNA-binding transcriptional repressor) of toxin-antitoxin stability system